MASNYKHTILQTTFVLCDINYEWIASEQSPFIVFSLYQWLT